MVVLCYAIWFVVAGAKITPFNHDGLIKIVTACSIFGSLYVFFVTGGLDVAEFQEEFMVATCNIEF